MADPALKISAELTGLEKSAQRALRNIEKNTRIRVQVDDKASLPLGRIAKNASDIEDSLDAATSRVIAFGAAAAVFTGIAKTFDNLVTSIIEVEDALARININFGATQSQLQSFSKEVFNAARNTAKTFEEAAKAAEELARQGLGTDETIKRLNDALILSRRAGIDSAEAVDTLTAAYNSFASAGLDTTQIINKLVAVDTRFAVSTKDLSEAISRAASTAQEAGVSFDEFLGIVTAVQQTTARGGAVIGNALKTIFTRVQAAPETIKALEDLGIAITDSSGAFTSAGDRLRQYAAIRQTLSEGDRAYYDRIVSGTQQINILAAALNDLGEANGIAARAQRISSQATNEAILQNEKLNETLKSVLAQTGTSFTQLFSSVGGASGEQLKEFLSGFNSILSVIIDSESAIKGLANVLSGPALVGGVALLGKVFFDILGNLKTSLGAVIGLDKASRVRLDIEKQIAVVTSNATSEEIRRLNAANSLTERRSAYLAIEQRVTAELLRQSSISSSLANSLAPATRFAGKIGGIGTFVGSQSRVSPFGGVTPNFADPLRTAIQREIQSGVPASQIYIDSDPRVKGPGNPSGLLVANKIDEPLGGFQGVNRALRDGRNPKKSGFVPNFAEFDRIRNNFLVDKSGINLSPSEIDSVNKGIDAYKSALKENSQILQKQAKDYIKTLNLNQESRNFVQLVLEQEKKNFAIESSQNKKIAKQKEQLFKEIEKQKNLPAGPNLTSANAPFEIQRRSPLIPERPEIIAARVAAIRGRRQYDSPIGPVSTGGRDIDFSAFDAISSSTRGGVDPSEERLSSIGTASRRAFSILERERVGEIEDALANQTLKLLSQSTLPNDRQIASIQKKIRKKVLTQLESDPDFSRFLLKGKFSEDAPKELVDLFDNRVAKELTSFESALSKARKRVIDTQNTQTIKSAFEGRGVGFFGRGDKKIADQLLSDKSIAPRNRELVQSILAERDQRRFQRRQTATLGAAFALPFAAGFIGEGIGGTAGGIARGGVSGALQGAGLGALLGPVGAGVGALLGGLAGAFNKLEKSSEELSKQFQSQNEIQVENINNLKAFVQIQEQLKQARESGEVELVERLGKQSLKIEKTLESEVSNRFRSGGVNSLKQSLEQRETEQTKAEIGQSLSVLLKEGLLGTDFSEDRARQIDRIAKFAAANLSQENIANLSGLNRQRFLGIEETGFGNTRGSSFDRILKDIRAGLDPLIKEFPELAEVGSVTGNNLKEVARLLGQIVSEAKNLTEEQRRGVKEQEKQVTEAIKNRNRLSFSSFGPAESAGFFETGLLSRRGGTGSKDIVDRATIASIKAIEDANLGVLPQNLKGLRESTESRLGQSGIISAIEGLLTGSLGQSSQSLGLIGNNGERNPLAIIRSARNAKNSGILPQNIQPQIEALLQIAESKGIGAPLTKNSRSGIQAFSPGSSPFNPENTILFGNQSLRADRVNPGNTIIPGGGNLPPSNNRLSPGSSISINGQRLPIPTIEPPTPPSASQNLPPVDTTALLMAKTADSLTKAAEINAKTSSEIAASVKIAQEAITKGLKVEVLQEVVNKLFVDEEFLKKVNNPEELKQAIEELLKRTSEVEKAAGVVRPPKTDSRGVKIPNINIR